MTARTLVVSAALVSPDEPAGCRRCSGAAAIGGFLPGHPRPGLSRVVILPVPVTCLGSLPVLRRGMLNATATAFVSGICGRNPETTQSPLTRLSGHAVGEVSGEYVARGPVQAEPRPVVPAGRTGIGVAPRVLQVAQ